MGNDRARFRAGSETLLAALAGIFVFNVAGLPAATLSGAMVGSAILLAAGRPIHLSGWIRDFGMLLGGLAMGSSVTPEMLNGLQRYPLSLVLFGLSVATMMIVIPIYLRRVAGWDRATAFFASAPGALTTVLAVAADTRADLLKVTMAQSLRLFMLVAVLPSVVAATGSAGAPLAHGIASGPALVLMIIGGGLIGYALMRLGMAAPWIFGGMVFSALLHGSALVVGDPPNWLLQIGFGIIGVFIGTRFSQITRKVLFSALAVSVVAFLIGLAISVIFALLASQLIGVPFGQALVAYAPGGLEAMIILGAALDLDPIFVGLHHLVRFFGIGLLIPFTVSWAQRD